MNKRFYSGRSLHGLFAFIALVFITATVAAEERVIWISIGDGLTSQASIEGHIDDANTENYNAISILARYRANAYYIPNRTDDTYTNNEPRVVTTFDPVQVAIDRARSHGMRVYAAWSVFAVTDGSNLYPGILPVGTQQYIYQGGTNDSTYDPDPGFPRIADQSEGGGAMWMDPAHPDTGPYNIAVLQDFVANYDVDGIVLDRIRYPGDSLPRRNGSFGYNPAALTALGLSNPAPGDSTFLEAKRDAVSDFIADARAAVHAIKPWIIFGATPVVFGTSTLDTYSLVYQDIPEWNTRANSDHVSGLGILDTVMPQYYRTSDADNLTLMNLIAPDAGNLGHQAIFQGFLGTLTASAQAYAENICDTRGISSIVGFGIFAASDALDSTFTSEMVTYNAACGTDVLGSASPLTNFTDKVGWDSTAPGNIIDLAANPAAVQGQVELTWTAPVDAVKYLVYRDSSSPVDITYDNLINKSYDVEATSFIDHPEFGLGSGTWFYQVLPVDDYNNKGTSNTPSATVTLAEVIVESRTAGGATTASPAYSESGAFSNTSAKSQQSGLTGSGSRFSTTVGNSAAFAPAITTAARYDLYVTLRGSGSPVSNTNANANSNWTLDGDNAESDSGSVFLTFSDAEMADNWKLLSSMPVRFNIGGAALARGADFFNVDGNSGTGARFNMDAVRFLQATGAEFVQPNTVSITPLDSLPITDGTFRFEVEFDEPVLNFDSAADLNITAPGLTFTVDVDQSTATKYIVTLENITGSGNIDMSVSTSSDVTDLNLNALASGSTSGPVFLPVELSHFGIE